MATKKEKLVSIIIPAYNASAYIKEAIDSALAQTYENCEVIIVDDGSTDNTKAVVSPFLKDRKVRYIFQANKGLAGARNTGIRASGGSYIALLDSDDIFLPDKIKEQVAALEARPDFGVCYCDLLHFTDTEPRKIYHHRYRYPSGDILESLLHRQFVNPLTVVVRREVFERHGYFDEGLRRSEDWDLWLRWAHAGVKFYYLDNVLARYRVRNVGNLSSVESEPEMKRTTLELFARFGETLSGSERQKFGYSKILKNFQLKAVFACLMAGDKVMARDRAHGLSPLWRLVVDILPAKAWRSLLSFWRRMKHRLLLKKI